LSSCQGELAGKKFQVKAVDQEGKVIIVGTRTTLRNGFFELWVPRNRHIELAIKSLNRSAKGTIETYDNSPTCITTFQLK